jgi:hypothetical protein
VVAGLSGTVLFVNMRCKNPTDALYRGNGGITEGRYGGGNVGGAGVAQIFMIRDIYGNEYNVDDPDAFVTNTQYGWREYPTNPIYISADKAVYVERDKVKNVVISNVTFKLQNNFFSYAFYNCVNLTSVVFHNITIDRNNVTAANQYFQFCFYGCTSLTAAPIIPPLPNGVTTAFRYQANVFAVCSALVTPPLIIHPLPGTVTVAWAYLETAFAWCGKITYIPSIPPLPNSVSNADYYMTYFAYGCTSLVDAPAIPPLPNTVTSLEYYLSYVFYNCTLLTNDLIPDIPPFMGTGIAEMPVDCTIGYAGGTCPATPDTPITTLEQLRTGYNYN